MLRCWYIWHKNPPNWDGSPWTADIMSLPAFEILTILFLHTKINYTSNIFTAKKRQIASEVAFLPDWLHCRNCLWNSLFNKSFVLMSKSSTGNHKSFSIFMCSKLYLKSKAHKYNFTHQKYACLIISNYEAFCILNGKIVFSKNWSAYKKLLKASWWILGLE